MGQGWSKIKPCGARVKTLSFGPASLHCHPYVNIIMLLEFKLRENYNKPTCGMTCFHFAYLCFNHLHYAHLNFNPLPIRYPPHHQTLEKHLFIQNQNIIRIKNTNPFFFSSWALETWKSLVLSWGFDFFDRAFLWGWGSNFGLSRGIEYSKIDHHQVRHFYFMWVLRFKVLMVALIHRKLIIDVFFEWKLLRFKWTYVYIWDLCAENKSNSG